MEYSDPILPVCPPKEGHSPQPKDKQSFVWISHLTMSAFSTIYGFILYLRVKEHFWPFMLGDPRS